MSEWFCRFFLPSLSKFTQTSCAFQARGVPAEKPAQLAMYLPRKPRSSHGASGEKPHAPAARGVPAEKPAHSKAQRARTHKKSPDTAQ